MMPRAVEERNKAHCQVLVYLAAFQTPINATPTVQMQKGKDETMFDSAKLKHTLDKKNFKEMEPQLRDDLLDAQFELVEQKRKTILILLNGPDGVGKGPMANLLYRWLDPRHVQTMAYDSPTDDERRRPFIWKYWRDMPARGKIGIVLGSWYHKALEAQARNEKNAAEFSLSLENINRFEAMLAAEGVIILKLWLHLDADEAYKRLKKAQKGNAFKRPSVLEWAKIDKTKERQRLVEAATEIAYQTSSATAPWHVVPATDHDYCAAMVGKLLLETLHAANRNDPSANQTAKVKTRKLIGSKIEGLPRVSILSSLDLSKKLSDNDYKKELKKQQERLSLLTSDKKFRQTGLVCVFEGNDAAGKGGAIMRLRQAMDLRLFRVIPIAAPNDEERARPYLWRFWHNIPAHGHVTIFDRSWYGRVLVERVEGFCSESDWQRAYEEINDFENALHRANYTVVKFWLATSQDEQLKRFKEREDTPFKRFKITDEDWRNRDKWPLYEEAVTDMIDRTSTPTIPWTLVEAEDKNFARVKVVKTVADKLEATLKRVTGKGD